MFVSSSKSYKTLCKHMFVRLFVALSSDDVPLIVLHDHLDSVVLLVVGVGLNGAMALNDAVLNMRVIADVYII